MKLGASGFQEYLQAMSDTRGIRPPMIVIYTRGIPFTNKAEIVLKSGASYSFDEKFETRDILPFR